MNESLLFSGQDFPEEPKSDRRRLANLFLLLALVFGVLFLFLEPPFVVPDENAHMMNIYRISHGSLFFNVEEGRMGSVVSAEEHDFLSVYGGKYNGAENPERYNLQTMRELSARPVSTETLFAENTFADINPFSYLVATLGVLLARLFSGGALNAYGALLAAKFANLIFYAFIIRLAILRTGAFRNTIFLLSLMPMAIFEGASASYDSILIASAFLLFAETTRILRREQPIDRTNVAIVCVAVAFLVSAKLAYAPLVLILLAIPPRKFGGWKRYFLCFGAVALIGLVFCIFPMVLTKILSRDVVKTLTDAQVEQQAYVSAHPGAFPNAVFHSIGHFGGYWLESFFGILGWLDTYFPKLFVNLFFVFSTFTALADLCDVPRTGAAVRVLSPLGVLIFLVGSFYTMYLQWNPVLVGAVGGDLIYGCQGRYFIPVAPFVLIPFANPLLRRIKLGGMLKAIRASLVSIVAVCYLVLTAALLLVRYWI